MQENERQVEQGGNSQLPQQAPLETAEQRAARLRGEAAVGKGQAQAEESLLDTVIAQDRLRMSAYRKEWWSRFLGAVAAGGAAAALAWGVRALVRRDD